MNNNQWREPRSGAIDPLWDDERPVGECDLCSDEEQDDDAVGLLEALLIGQSLTVGWFEDRPWLAVENIVVCTCCREALTELRLAFTDPRYNKCPICGEPPEA